MPDRPIAVTILNLTHPNKAGNLKAFVDVQVGSTLTIFGCRVIQQPGQRAWVSPPQREWTTPDGTKKFSPVIEWRGPLKDAVERTILDAYGKESPA